MLSILWRLTILLWFIIFFFSDKLNYHVKDEEKPHFNILVPIPYATDFSLSPLLS